MMVVITYDEILTTRFNSLIEIAAIKGFPITPISRKIDWTKAKKVIHYHDPCTQNHITE